MARPEPEGRSNLSVGMEWATTIASVGLEFALPPLAGAYLDTYWRFSPLGVLVGVFVGFGVGMLHILRIARSGPGAKRRKSGD